VTRERTRSTAGKKYLFFLSLSALGVVYGDIGTSPLYAVQACFNGPHALNPTGENILGVVSLILWSLVIVISFKYMILILRAYNGGEGGIMALMELVLSKKVRSTAFILSMGLFGAALLYGDGTITPAISVLSAMEGLSVATPLLTPYIVPAAIAILFFLFLLQHRGTGNVGLLFGPIMMVWFLVIGFTGAKSIFRNPSILTSLNPYHAVHFFTVHGFSGFFTLGSVFLVVTGGEALYADIGHFGTGPIRAAWFTLVLPCLLLNYLGKGALLIENPAATSNPFYHLVPAGSIYPMVVLSLLATVIASEAVIAGVFSLTFQALQLGYIPRLIALHTSEEERGQIYMPQVNWVLFLATAAVVAGFKTSTDLSTAYGIAVSATMFITTLLGFTAMRNLWNWPKLLAITTAAVLLAVDLSFFGANMLKVLSGGFFPLLVGSIVFLLMRTWLKGRKAVAVRLRKYGQPLKAYLENIDERKIRKVGGYRHIPRKKPAFYPPPVHLQHHPQQNHSPPCHFSPRGVQKNPACESGKPDRVRETESGLFPSIGVVRFHGPAQRTVRTQDCAEQLYENRPGEYHLFCGARNPDPGHFGRYEQVARQALHPHGKELGKNRTVFQHPE
jgi:KUP system potassium uptake protein